MKRLIIITTLVFLLLVPMIPFTKHGQDGAYNSFSRLAYCETRVACMHEIGHALDQRAGWVSQSDAFYKAVQMYLVVELKKPTVGELPLCILELTYRGRDGKQGPMKRELYAYLFEQANGQRERVPEDLQQFYDWQRATELVSKLNDGKLYVLR